MCKKIIEKPGRADQFLLTYFSTCWDLFLLAIVVVVVGLDGDAHLFYSVLTTEIVILDVDCPAQNWRRQNRIAKKKKTSITNAGLFQNEEKYYVYVNESSGVKRCGGKDVTEFCPVSTNHSICHIDAVTVD